MNLLLTLLIFLASACGNISGELSSTIPKAKPVFTIQVPSQIKTGQSVSATIEIRDSKNKLVISGPDANCTLVLSDALNQPIQGATRINTVNGRADISSALFAFTKSGTTQLVVTKIETDALLGGSVSSSTKSQNLLVLPSGFSASQSTLSINTSSVLAGDTATATLTARDSFGNQLTTGGLGALITLSGSGNSGATLSSPIDLGNGTYTASLLGVTGGTARSLTATLDSVALTSMAPMFTVSPKLSVSPVAVFEGDTAKFTAHLNATSTFPVTFDWTTLDGSAVSGTNYTAASGTGATIAAGSTDIDFTIPTLSDATPNEALTFQVRLSNVAHSQSAPVTSNIKVYDPSLTLDFTTGSLPVDVTLTRASNATYFDADGILQTATADTPRFNHAVNPVPTPYPSPIPMPEPSPPRVAHSPVGLTIEDASTNLLGNSVGASASSSSVPNGWAGTNSGEIDTFGYSVLPSNVFTGFNNFDTNVYNDTNSGVYKQFTVSIGTIAVTPNTTYTYSFYAQTVSGITTFPLFTQAVFLTASYGYDGNKYVGADLHDTTMTRNSVTFTTSANAYFARFEIIEANIYPGGYTTLRIVAPQVELGTQASSLIPTSVSAPAPQSRLADTANLTTLSPWYSQSAGTWQLTVTPQSDEANLWYLSASSATPASDNYGIYLDPSLSKKLQLSSTTGGASQILLNTTLAVPPRSLSKIAFAYSDNSNIAAVNGALSPSNLSSLTPVITNIKIGADPTGSNHSNGDYKTLKFFPARLSDSSVQALTP